MLKGAEVLVICEILDELDISGGEFIGIAYLVFVEAHSGGVSGGCVGPHVMELGDFALPFVE